jgi:hypothetical protein
LLHRQLGFGIVQLISKQTGFFRAVAPMVGVFK